MLPCVRGLHAGAWLRRHPDRRPRGTPGGVSTRRVRSGWRTPSPALRGTDRRGSLGRSGGREDRVVQSNAHCAAARVMLRTATRDSTTLARLRRGCKRIWRGAHKKFLWLINWLKMFSARRKNRRLEWLPMCCAAFISYIRVERRCLSLHRQALDPTGANPAQAPPEVPSRTSACRNVIPTERGGRHRRGCTNATARARGSASERSRRVECTRRQANVRVTGL